MGRMTTPKLTGSGRATEELARARTCYDHLAGRLGVSLTDAMIAAGLLDQAAGLVVTQAGLAWLAATLEIDVAALASARRPLARSCLDWTERRPHLAGAAGAAVCGAAFARDWIARVPGQRAVRVTEAGELALLRLGGLDLSEDGAQCGAVTVAGTTVKAPRCGPARARRAVDPVHFHDHGLPFADNANGSP